jgi:hypothetical protein
MTGHPRHAADEFQERAQFSETRRAMLWLGGRLSIAAGLSASLGALSAEAKKKKKRKKKKPKPQPDIVLQAANMTGDKEVPSESGDSLGSGSATFTFKANGQVCCDFTFTTTTPDSEVILTHIHEGAAGEEGNVVIDFNAQLETCVTAPLVTRNAIIANPAGFYANLHTNKFPNGAVRDQLAPVPG